MRSFKKLSAAVFSLAATVAISNVAGCPNQGDVIQDIPPTNPIPNPTPQTPDPQTPTPPAKPLAPKLFVTGITTQSLQSFSNPALLNGNVAPLDNLAGAQTELAAPYDIAVTADGLMVVSNHVGNSLTFFADADSINGNQKPLKNISGAATQISAPRGLAWDAATDGLFVSDVNIASPIKLFGKISEASTLGNIAPLHSIQSPDIKTPMGISLSKSGALYVANAQTPNATVAVFENAVNVNGTVSANRVISSPAFGTFSLQDVQVTADDTMYVLTLGNQVHVFKGASTLNGAVMPDSTLTVAASLRAIAVDKFGVGYLTDQSATPRVLVFDSIASRNGTFTADRQIGGNLTQIASPWGIFLWE